VTRVPRLHRVDPTTPGIARRRRGKGFSYEDARGRPVRDPAVLERIRGLAIPPAWVEVWICPDPEGHLQAAGDDAAGRRQYLYHPAWRERQDVRKFRRIEEFARSLPGMRSTIEAHLDLDGLPKERVMAVAVRLLDRTTFRIGSEAYADANGSFGLATIRKSDVTIDGPRLIFDYVGKGGARRVHEVRDARLTPLLGRMKRRRGGGVELLAYREAGRWRDVRSGDVNAYLKDLLGPDHSAKDFRTWHATMLAAIDIAHAHAELEGSKASRRRAITATVARVAEHMGNTPAVCRASYIDPRVFDRFREGRTIAPVVGRTPSDDDEAVRERVERAVLELLAGDDQRAAAA
jgi:DNA topoisomerase IB